MIKAAGILILKLYQVEFTDNAGINRPTQGVNTCRTLYYRAKVLQAHGSTVPFSGVE